MDGNKMDTPLEMNVSIDCIKNLVDNKNYEEALALCPPLTKKSNVFIEKKKITLLFLLKKYEEIIKECSIANGMWKDDYFTITKNVAVGHLVRELNERGDFPKALALFKSNFSGTDDKEVVISIVKALETDGKISEEIEYFTDELCGVYKDFWQKKIYLLFILKRYEEIVEEALSAYSTWKDECFLKSRDTAISHIIKTLVSDGKYEEALIYYEYRFFEPNQVLETQRIMILLELKKYQEVVQVCTENLKIWKKEPFFIERKKQALEYLRQEQSKNNGFLTKIYFDALSFEELESLEMDDFEKMILQIAYYEKSKKVKKGLQLIKKGLLTTSFTEEEKNILGCLKEKFISKISSKRYKLVDWNYYCSILNCFIDKDYETKEKSSLRKLEMKK